MAEPASGIPALVRRLRGNTEAQQVIAAGALMRQLMDSWEAGDLPRLDALASGIVAAGAVGTRLTRAAGVLQLLSTSSPHRADAVLAAGACRPLAQLMHSDIVDLQSSGLCALSTILHLASSNAEAGKAAAVAAGAAHVAIQRLCSVDDPGAMGAAASILASLAHRSPARCQAIYLAGGVPPLVHCMQRGRSDAQDLALEALRFLADGSAERSQTIVAADGPAACVAALTQGAPSPKVQLHATLLLNSLARNGQDQAVVAADPTSATEHALEVQGLTASVTAVAAARRAAQAANAPAAAAAAPAAPPPANAASLSPPRVCSGPGCGATQGRLNRCAGCGAVRYCGEACQAAHWCEHRPDCKRLQAAAAEAAAASSGAGDRRGPDCCACPAPDTLMHACPAPTCPI